MRLLIVEDNKSMRRLLTSILSDLTEVIGECEDGVEALAAYERLQPDFVLMDIMMAKLDGIEATRLMKAVYPEARIIVVTEYDDLKLRAAASEAGAEAYVVKENLLKLRKLLEAK